MDAIKFVKTLQRKIKDENRDEIIIRSTDDASLFVDLVEEWDREHPTKTRQSVFLEQHPETRIDEADGVLHVCPAIVSTAHIWDDGGCADISKECAVCCREFWMQEVE